MQGRKAMGVLIPFRVILRNLEKIYAAHILLAAFNDLFLLIVVFTLGKQRFALATCQQKPFVASE